MMITMMLMVTMITMQQSRLVYTVHVQIATKWVLIKSMPRVSLCTSIYLIMAVALERYLAVCRPFHYHQLQVANHL